MKKKELNPRLNQVGGQAVLEGVMMKAGNDCATACRREDGSIAVIPRKFVSVRKKHKILNIPFLRGVINFVEMLVLSMGTLTASAEVVAGEEELPESKFEIWLRKHLGLKLYDIIMALAVVLGVALALGLFMFLPRLAATGIGKLADRDLGIWRALIEGGLKVCFFIVYLVLVSLIPDIKRTFEYHGAEHKSIACYESGDELIPSNAKKHTRFHPRCGTSFMFVMILIGVVVGIFVNRIFPNLNSIAYTGIRLLILPLVVGIGYEFIMFAGKHDNPVTRVLSAPGLWMQRITTREPDEKQLEVAICALKYALVSAFPDFDREAVTYHPETKEAEEDVTTQDMQKNPEGLDRTAELESTTIHETVHEVIHETIRETVYEKVRETTYESDSMVTSTKAGMNPTVPADGSRDSADAKGPADGDYAAE